VIDLRSIEAFLALSEMRISIKTAAAAGDAALIKLEGPSKL